MPAASVVNPPVGTGQACKPLLAWPGMLARFLVATLLVASFLAAHAGAAPRSSVPSAPVGAVATEQTPVDVEAEDATERPEGGAWIVGIVIFGLAVALVVGGRWWVRNRVGRVQR